LCVYICVYIIGKWAVSKTGIDKRANQMFENCYCQEREHHSAVAETLKAIPPGYCGVCEVCGKWGKLQLIQIYAYL
jgi:hypothetical protein